MPAVDGGEARPLRPDTAGGDAEGSRSPPKPPSLKFTPKYRERNIYRRDLEKKVASGKGAKPFVSREEMLSRHVQSLGFSNAFLKLHFMMLYVVQIMAQLGIVTWSIVLFGLNNGANTDPVWLACVAAVDCAITTLLVIDLVSHLADNAAGYWKDCGNRLDALLVVLSVCALLVVLIVPTVDNEIKAEEGDAFTFAARVLSDVMRVVRVALFVRRIRKAITWSKESLGYATSKGYGRKLQNVCVVIPDLSKQCPHLVGQEPQAFFAVYESQGGIEAAECAGRTLHQAMSESTQFEDNEHVQGAIAEALFLTSERIDELPGGSTTCATCLLIRERTVYGGWVGDAHAVLSRGGRAMPITSGAFDPDHALGQLHKVDAQPKLMSRAIEGQDQFIIVASSALWEAIEPQQAVGLVTEFLHVFGDSRAASEELMDEALRKQKPRAEANVSVVVVWFQETQLSPPGKQLVVADKPRIERIA